MREVTEEEFNNTKPLDIIVLNKSKLATIKDDEVEWNKLLKEMETPLNAQRELATKMKIFVDEQIEKDIKEYNGIRESTRRFINDYNIMLTNLHKSTFGDKTSVDVNISHSMIASKIRSASKYIDIKGD